MVTLDGKERHAEGILRLGWVDSPVGAELLSCQLYTRRITPPLLTCSKANIPTQTTVYCYTEIVVLTMADVQIKSLIYVDCCVGVLISKSVSQLAPLIGLSRYGKTLI